MKWKLINGILMLVIISICCFTAYGIGYNVGEESGSLDVEDDSITSGSNVWFVASRTVPFGFTATTTLNVVDDCINIVDLPYMKVLYSEIGAASTVFTINTTLNVVDDYYYKIR